MAAKVLIERLVQHGHETEIIALLKDLRTRCLDQPGYLRGETLRDATNPSRLLVISHWSGLAQWRDWETSADRDAIEGRIRPHLEQDPAIDVYLEGLSEEISGA